MELRKKLKSGRLTQLALRMQKGDRKAAAALYDELAPKLYGFLFTRTNERETVEDLSQEIFIKLLEKIGSFDASRGAFTVWFWQIARNALIDHYREKKPVPFSSFEEEAVPLLAVAGAPNFDHWFGALKVRQWVETLEESDRELFQYRFVAEMPYSEMAALCGKSEGALRIAVSRLKSKIKKEFGNSL
ncbi:MAG: RNA polymerase sigma factor [Patescibacteria group bacterium]|nr:RNA polymerase sigma factor [Patescibacteria group bacterium]